jgi:hypothetical protein
MFPVYAVRILRFRMHYTGFTVQWPNTVLHIAKHRSAVIIILDLYSAKIAPQFRTGNRQSWVSFSRQQLWNDAYDREPPLTSSVFAGHLQQNYYSQKPQQA